MMANWGYQDGSGNYFITIDTDKCDGCSACVEACPQGVLELGEDPADPLRAEPVAFLGETQRKKLKFAYAPCKTYLTSKGGTETGMPSSEMLAKDMQSLPCVAACDNVAITHSW